MTTPRKRIIRGRRGPTGWSAKELLIQNGDLPQGASDDAFTAFLLAQSAYVHTQSSASTEWVVNHNLARRPFVAVTSPGGVEVMADVLHQSDNQVRIRFATAYAGVARCF